jgi:DNA-binding IclR family transcriptional regulator
MSVRVTTWVWENSPASGTELLILLALADQSDDDGLSWPSIAYIARKTRLHEDTVNRNLRSLVDRGEVTREERPGRSNLLRIVRTPPQVTGGSSSGGSTSGGSQASPFMTRGSAAIDPALAEDMRRNPHKYR